MSMRHGPWLTPRRARGLLMACLAAACAGGPARAQQESDPNFAPAVGSPAWEAGAGPVVLLDEAHANFHTLEGRYQAFGRLLAADGFVVKAGRERFTAASLSGARVLAIANALHPSNAGGWILPNPPAFEESEIRAVQEWVRAGGSLLLIADHMPFAGAAETLAASFGVLFANGFAMTADLASGRFGFDRPAGGLADHPVTRGRSPREAVTAVTAFTGSAFRLGGAGQPLLTLPESILLMPEEAWKFSPRTPRLRGDGMLQGAVLRSGRGRVAVFAEAAMFTAQLSGPERAPMGMNEKGAAQNAQFLLNVMHWLAGLIEPD